MKKFPFILLLYFACVGHAHAIERLLSVGQGFSQPYYFSPDTRFQNRAYHLNMGYYFQESIQLHLGLQFALGGDKSIHLRLGPEFYLLKDQPLLPWVGAKYVYTIEPSGDQGWLLELGVERNLDFLFDFQNVALRASTGFSYVYVKSGPDRNYFEMIQLALLFAF